MCFLLGTREVQAARLHRGAETAKHSSVFANHDAGHPASREPVLDGVQWYVMQKQFSLKFSDVKYFHNVVVSISVLSTGSLYIYNICRFLMSMSHSAQVTNHACFQS